MVCQMKALVLSGGAGTRLRPITHTSAGHLDPVADRAALLHGPEPLARAGVTDDGPVEAFDAEPSPSGHVVRPKDKPEHPRDTGDHGKVPIRT